METENAGTGQGLRPEPGITDIQRKPLSSVVLDPNEIDRLRLAYKNFRQFTSDHPNDPRGYLQQANLHCFHCGHDTLDVHDSPYFLPWHRAFIYYHERILCELIPDPTFRLPYWDWDEPTTVLPGIDESVRQRIFSGNAAALYARRDL